MGRGSGGVTGTKRGSNKMSPTEIIAAKKSSESAMSKAAYSNGSAADRQAAVDKAAAQVRKVAANMTTEGVEAWHKQALKAARELEAPSTAAKFSVKGKLNQETVKRDQLELTLRQYLMKKNPKKYNTEWATTMMFGN